jgi:predicted house-cleaning noncanonical NTP pyrophosphatase (MazG superfamily)
VKSLRRNKTVTTRYRKLVRDRIPEIISGRGLKCNVRRLAGRRYEKALREKVLEEASELLSSRGREEVLNELIDIQELINALRRKLGVGPKRFRQLVARKRKKRGGFTKRLFLESVKDPGRSRPGRTGRRKRKSGRSHCSSAASYPSGQGQ